jgi:uncharacterized protein YebE (UPF0316 family)
METFDWYNWAILPAMIFAARILDVTLGTLRIIFVARGKKRIAPILGFIEVFIWIVVVSQLIGNLQNWIAYLAYAAGFATGNYVGMWIEDRLAMGTLVLRVILPQGSEELAGLLRQAGYGATQVDGEGGSGPVKLIYTVVKRKNLGDVVSIIHAVNPKAFFSVEEVRSAQEGIFPAPSNTLLQSQSSRKGK